MLFRAVLSACLLAALVVAAPARAAVYNLFAVMKGAAENPPNASPGNGLALAQLDTTAKTLSLQVNFSDLTGTTRMAHIHCCTTAPANVGVATQLPSFSGFPLGVTSGTYSQIFDMNLASSWNPAFVTANGGTPAGAFAAFSTGMLDGRAYFNVHTSTFPGGEIRGFFQVPEPGVLGLLGVAVIVLAWVARRAGRKGRRD